MLVATVMAATSGTGIGIASLRRQPTSVVFTVVVTLLGLGLVASVVASVAALTSFSPSMHAGVASPRQRWQMVRAVAITMGFLLVLFLFGRLRRHPTFVGPHPGGSTGQVRNGGAAPFHIVPTASFVTVGVVAALFVALVVVPAAMRWRGAGWRSRAGAPDALASPWGQPPGEGHDHALARSVLGVDVADPRREPDPRRAVVAAYLQMTAAAERAGAGRAPDETAREFLGRLLDSLGVSAAPARALTGVFERARYGFETVQERDRETAIDALKQIRGELSAHLPDEPSPAQAAVSEAS